MKIKMDEYQHSLSFEAKNLTDEDQERIRRYFQKRRESGGGDCGMIEKAEDNTYKICFKEKEDQERVLQRNIHSINLPSGALCLTVRQSSSTQTVAKTNTKGLEKIFKIDIYLMYYLRLNPKVYKILQKQLSAIDCSVELNFDEEELVVRGDIKKGPEGGLSSAENWGIQVDQVITGFTKSYVCRHVLDPKQNRLLQQDTSLEAENVTVYREAGYSVVVGEFEAVNETIANLEKSVSIHKNIPVVEKTFKLVEDEFTKEMRESYPEVKMIIKSDLITLEGPNKEVQSGATRLDEFMNKIQEKRVNLPTVLLNFVKSSGAISRYQSCCKQNLKNPVSMEIGSKLVLASLSSDALDEAKAAILRDLKVDTVKFHGAGAEPPDLDKVKDLLTKARNEENHQEQRVEFRFIPGIGETAVTKVQLVGYSENVNKLKEVLNDFQLNHETQEVMNLSPELVDCFDEVLNLMGWRNSNVTIKPSHSPRPCLLLSGTRCLVNEAQTNLTASLANLISETLVLDGSGAQRYFQEEGKMYKELVESACKVIIRERQQLNSPNMTAKPRSISSASTWSLTPKSVQMPQTNLEIKIGSLEDEQVNVLVVPMLNKKLTTTNTGKRLLDKAGEVITRNFDLKAATCSLSPGDVLQVDAPPSLGCSKIFFIECLQWDGVRGQSVQALNKGLKRCLELCVQQHHSSVAFSVIGPGPALKYPLREAIEVLTENMRQFGSCESAGSLSNIHVVISNVNAEKCYHDVYRGLSLIMTQSDQVIFRSVTSDLDEVTMTVAGGVKLQLIFGDITNETTDAIVNTTNFVDFHESGVCKDILTVAGQEIEAELGNATVKEGEVFVTNSGSFPCKNIFHVSGRRDPVVIYQIICDIIDHCETLGLKSVAIPAICAGAGGLDPGVVAEAILQGIKTSTSSTSLYSLTDIRIVLYKINVFLAFKEEAMQVFALINRVSASQLPPVHQHHQEQPTLANTDLSVFDTSSTNQQSTFLFLGLSRENVSTAMTKLKDLYQAQCSTETFTEEQLEVLTQDDMNDLQQLVETQGLYMQRDQSGQGSLTVSGLKDGVSQVMQMVIGLMQGTLIRELIVREEEDLYNRVAWCILGNYGNWERLPKEANYDLENNEIAAGIVDTHGISWSIDLENMEATRQETGQTAKLKRLENLPDFTLPLYWDNMTINETMEVVCLQSSSAEYQTVKETFKRTVPKTVMKIERVQNVHLRRAYEALKKQISDKNNLLGGAGEKFLYHGTSQENCMSIMKTGFNRSFAGQNATSYGHGTYFAVNANYSANRRYSRPADDGSQLMFVARVLTGTYTEGSSDMKVPPPLNDQKPGDRYDSLVDRMDNPNMFVVFHDSQAYPDYLITFK